MDSACAAQRFRGFGMAPDFRELLYRWQGSLRNFFDERNCLIQTVADA